MIVVAPVAHGDDNAGVDDDHADVLDRPPSSRRAIFFDRRPRSGSPSKTPTVRKVLRRPSACGESASDRSASRAADTCSSGTASNQRCASARGLTGSRFPIELMACSLYDVRSCRGPPVRRPARSCSPASVAPRRRCSAPRNVSRHRSPGGHPRVAGRPRVTCITLIALRGPKAAATARGRAR